MICCGFLRNNFSAHFTIRSNPPAACMQLAAAMTDTIISMTSIGGAVGSRPKPNVRIAKPAPPRTPKPIPPKRAPIMMATRTKNNCTSIILRFLRCFLPCKDTVSGGKNGYLGVPRHNFLLLGKSFYWKVYFIITGLLSTSRSSNCGLSNNSSACLKI